MKTRAVYIAGSARTPFVKSLTTFRDITTQELMTYALQGLVERLQLQDQLIGDVGLGAVISSSFNWNLARECVLSTSLDPNTPAYNLQRACGTSLETTAQIALKIANYQMENGIAGGVDTNSDLPVMFKRSLTQKLIALRQAKTISAKIKILASMRLSDWAPQYPGIVEPRTHLSMGQHCELMVKEWKISRQAQDQLALQSHKNSIAAYDTHFYDDLIIPVNNLKQDSSGK